MSIEEQSSSLSHSQDRESPGQVRDLSRECELRLRAEARFKAIPGTGELIPGSKGEPDVASLLHELQVHQIELELQNEELRTAQCQLQTARDRYFDLYDLAPVGYCTVSAHGIVLDANLTLSTMLMTPRKACVGQLLTRFIFPPDQDIYYRHRNLLSLTGELQVCEVRMLRSDGAPLWVRMDGTIDKLDSEEQQLRIIVTDITERKQAEEELLKLTGKLVQTQKLEALGVLVAGVAHNINNVLAAIMATVSTRQQSVLGVEDTESYGIIDKACRRGREILQSLTRFSRPCKENHAPVELKTLVDEILGLLRGTVPDRIRVVRELPSQECWIMGDAAGLNLAIMNLCMNALDAMKKQGTLTIGIYPEGQDSVAVHVKDSGCGMTADILEKALDPFFTTKPVGKGTGLGLSMVYGVVKSLGGTMDLSSIPGQGTMVCLHLPLLHEHLAGTGDLNSVIRRTGRHSLNRILLVDDDEDVRFLVSMMLTKAGYTVKTVESGEECLDVLSAHEMPDLVILDQNMPGMSGDRTMVRIRAHFADLPILISSGQPGIEEWPCFKQKGVAVISKPFDLAELESGMARLDPDGTCWSLKSRVRA